jgi:hypothetical protein
LDSNSFAKIEALKQSDSKYKFLDNSVLYAMETSRKHLNKPVGLQMMYSILVLLEATALFEKHHKEYLDTGRHKL